MATLSKFFIGVVVLMVAMGSSNAALINNGDYTTDTETGLDWLDLSKTNGMNYISAQTLFSGDGWVHATESQFEGLIDSVFPSYAQTSTSGYMQVSGSDIVSYNAARNFKELFGTTCDSSNPVCSYGFYEVGGNLRLGGVYVYSGAYVYRDYTYNYSAASSSAHSNNSVGIFLVRTSSVSEPTSIMVLSLGLIGLGLARGNKKN
jgi:hypothetical protein